ncbi:uncharacterized protein LOC111233885 [Seriola dumerili]|uniref:uncharacterized protein LOC111233885 n=1 Tax=Seriola dumerili TaxID=41447 RepID=UPI000BBE574B|nr:uncharacterized protein LOC111233885 [Seriola dumerili]
MSARDYEILSGSSLGRNCIPTGQQLPRTPLSDVKRRLDLDEDSDESLEEPQENTAQTGARDQYNDLNRTLDVSTPEKRTESTLETGYLNSMLKGMKGYQLTAGDLEFIMKMKEEERLKKLEGELEEVRRSLQKETMAFEQACASRDMAQAELNKLPSCEELTECAQVVLKMTSPSAEFMDLDAKALLAMMMKEQVQRAMDEKRTELSQMEKMLAKK